MGIQSTGFNPTLMYLIAKEDFIVFAMWLQIFIVILVSEVYELCSGYNKPLHSPRSSIQMIPQGAELTTQDLLYQLEEVRIILLFLSHFVNMKIKWAFDPYVSQYICWILYICFHIKCVMKSIVWTGRMIFVNDIVYVEKLKHGGTCIIPVMREVTCKCWIDKQTNKQTN
jgi:hypothetical protein